MKYGCIDIDVENDEIQRYLDEVETKVGICKILPCARFTLSEEGYFQYDGLVCSDKMGGKQTGIAAPHCRNCLLKY